MKLAFTRNLDNYSEEAISQFIKHAVGERRSDGEGSLECEILSAERIAGTKQVRIELLIKKENKNYKN